MHTHTHTHTTINLMFRYSLCHFDFGDCLGDNPSVFHTKSTSSESSSSSTDTTDSDEDKDSNVTTHGSAVSLGRPHIDPSPSAFSLNVSGKRSNKSMGRIMTGQHNIDLSLSVGEAALTEHLLRVVVRMFACMYV